MGDEFLELENNQLASVAPIEAADGQEGKIPATNAEGLIDSSFLPDFPTATFPITLTLTAAVPIAGGSLVNLFYSSGLSALAAQPADAASGLGADAINGPAGAGTNEPVTVTLGFGLIAGLSGLTAGAEYYLGNAGALTASSGGAGTLYQYIGKAISATTLLFQPQHPGIQQ